MGVDRASRLIGAPRERIFEAFVDRDAIVQWLPPTGASAILDEFEPRPGGAFRMTLIFNDRGTITGKTRQNSDVVEGSFVELVPPERIVRHFTFVSEDPQFAGTMVMTWTLSAEPQGTLVNVAAENVTEGILPDEHRRGWIRHSRISQPTWRPKVNSLAGTRRTGRGFLRERKPPRSSLMRGLSSPLWQASQPGSR
jgi:uncharacterized protein YndB with AHSA1/START domain